MVMNWTPEEEEAWRELEKRCASKEETLQLAQVIEIGEIYYCRRCLDYHVKPLPSSAPSV